MIKKILTIVLILANLNAISQSYIPLSIDTSSFWVYNYSLWLNGSLKVSGEMTSIVEKDTAIIGTSYFKIITYPSAPPSVSDSLYLAAYLNKRIAFIREDSILQKVFQFDNVSLSDVSALNYNLSAGDTLPMIAYQGYDFLIDSINYQSVLGISRKFQHSHFLMYVPHYATIEGVGATSNFPATGHGEWGIPEFELKCYSKNGIKLYGDSLSNCKKNIPLSISQTDINNVEWNYSADRLEIRNSANQELKLRVINQFGSVLFEDSILGEFYSKQFESLASGVYLLQLQGTKINLTRKILID